MISGAVRSVASKLTGWQLNVMTQDQVAAKSEGEQETARLLFQEKLEVDAEIAAILVQEGFSTVEEIAYVPSAELLAVEGFDEDIVEELRARARDALLTEALAVEEGVGEQQPSDELLALKGMDEATAYALAAREVSTVDDLADLAVDDLIDIEGMNEERAAALIMAARAPYTTLQHTVHIHPTVSELIPTVLGELGPVTSMSVENH